ncbi:hypothetical protein SAMN05428985_104216 [Nocardioides sp. YR527]|uniref:hypothetical protein n=1 Tax=Nocardioides sp. YR527 TaxID=1881028 RepID=UPI0008881962|nr:hypothetical protein [Nocardioides sp. YR527]SDK48934.1 hypothetical protein SAMN05428985_104216 [Nocardioides sp. YR527]
MSETPPSGVDRWVSLATSFVAPVTVISAVLFYFGYVAARAQYDYFGLDVDVIGLSTRAYVMRSPQPLLTPMLVLVLGGVAVVALHRWVRGHATKGWFRRLVTAVLGAGLVLLAAGTVLLAGFTLVGGWAYYSLVTPVLLGGGAALVAYALRLRLGGRLEPRIVLLWVGVAACVIWATATTAQWTGRGLAMEQARNLRSLPSVVLDTKERLYIPAGAGVQEAVRAEAGEDEYRFRYWRLRLLIQGEDRMFLVPDTWSAGGTTIMVRLDDDVRVQFQFRNSPPD